MGKNFDSNYIKDLVEELSKGSSVSYEDLPNYDLFLSQVVDYLNDKFVDEEFTNNIVQNYMKSEVITKPEDKKKRGYTKTHLIQSLTHEDKFEKIVRKFNLKDKDEERIRIFLLVLSLISKASAIKKIVQKIVNEYQVD